MPPISPVVIHDYPATHSQIPEFSGSLIGDLTEVVKHAEGADPTSPSSEPKPQSSATESTIKAAGRFFTIKTIDGVMGCSVPPCGVRTRLLVYYNDGTESYEARPFCPTHAHSKFAEWMVGE